MPAHKEQTEFVSALRLLVAAVGDLEDVDALLGCRAPSSDNNITQPIVGA